ncbi:ABC transporter permease [Alkalibacter mobilis]|uniref:ABC transporter permease n=1 Tax=Alkalibacter mobilis TaxID=2787712 RepID=UPI0018A048B7|nr:ABC transporter permease [Alkalibacter mobilis]MBF7095565.1 ABC transporter permease [Alkalibacter mobilis]
MLLEFWDAIKLLSNLDSGLAEIVLLTIYVSGSAVLLAALLGIPAGTWLGMQKQGKVKGLTRLVYTLMGLPPVVGGLIIYLLIRRQGLLGTFGFLYTPTAMIMAQFLLATPIVIGMTSVAVRSKGKNIHETLVSLGARKGLILRSIIWEARYGILGAVIAGFGRVVAEVGAVMMVGGNIEGKTRVMTTTIVLETRKGNFDFALALGLILLIVSFIFNVILYQIQQGGASDDE